MDYEKLCKSLGKAFSVEVREREAERLGKALEFLGIDATPAETQGAARAVGAISMAASLLLIALLSMLGGFSMFWLLFILVPVVLYFYLARYPMLKADSEKKKARGQMPEVASYLIMSLRISPNLERSVEFAARHSQGLFKEKLSRIIRSVRAGQGNAESGLLKLGEDFGEKSDEFKRAIKLVVSSTLERTEDRRQDTLDKAANVLLGGLSARAEREARALNTPVMIVFTFGVILPLIFVAIIPFMSLMGVSVGAPAIAIMYAVALPLCLFVVVRFIAASRPATLPAPNVPTEKNTSFALFVSVAIGVFLSAPLLFGESLGPLEYTPLVWGFAAGAGLFLLLTTVKTRKLRKKTKELERGFGETLHQLGIVLSEGRPLEDAMSSSGERFLKHAANNIQRLNTPLRAAFFDERFGSLREVRSDSIRSVVDILVSVSDKGSDALANVCFRMSEHISNLKKSEAEIERALGGVVSSMKIIAMVVGPLVGGMISSMSVVLADTMVKSQEANMGFGGKAEPIDPSLITLIIGVYAMESAAILALFGAELMGGDDKVMKKYSIGLALPVSVFVFTVCAWFANELFGSIA